jgi:magnesium transporter
MLESGPFWMNFCNPSSNEMKSISKAFGLHPLTSEDIMVLLCITIKTPDTREKCEVFSNYYFVVVRTFEHDNTRAEYLMPIVVYIVIFKQCVLSVLN